MWHTLTTLRMTLRLVKNDSGLKSQGRICLGILTVHCCLWCEQFADGESGTPVKNTGFCGRWSLRNAEVLFKDSYTKESGNQYGALSLDKNPMVSSSLIVYIQQCSIRGHKRGDKSQTNLTCCWTAPFYFHLETFRNAFFFFQLCFAYKGMLKDVVGLKFTYRNTDGETLTETAKINTVFTKSHKWVKTMMCFGFFWFLLKDIFPQFLGIIDL